MTGNKKANLSVGFHQTLSITLSVIIHRMGEP